MRALVLGGASTVWEDAERAQSLGRFDTIIAVNDIGAVWPGRIDCWVSLHPDKLYTWMKAREAKGLNADYQTWAHKLRHKPRPVRIDNTTTDWCGSSGLLAVKVALIKHTRIVCAGIPMTPTPHFHKPKGWASASKFHKGWITHLPELAPFVRSMSGWTKSLLGEPTKTWLSS